MSALEPFDVRLAQDVMGFVRRQCPLCQREFKTRPSRHDAAAIRELLAQFVKLFDTGHSEEPGKLTCFYCGKASSRVDLLTGDQRGHLIGVAEVLNQQLRYEQLSQIMRALWARPKPTFTLVKPPELPARITPELDDMKLFLLVCCGDEAKAATGWNGAYFCPRCGVEHEGGRKREKQQLKFIRE